MNGLFSAARIAAVLGKSKRAVQLALRSVAPVGQIEVRGQRADAWSSGCLPSSYQDELDAIAKRLGYRNREHLLQDPPRRFAPRDALGRAIRVTEISESDVARAIRLRSVLALALQQISREGRSDDRALQQYRREFGNVSERHFRRMVKRTLQRDAGEERFDDIALYFGESIACKREVIPVANTAADRTLLDAINRVKNPSSPTTDESALIWTVACEVVADAAGESGDNQKRAQRHVLDLLIKSGVTIARTPEALRKNFKRKYKRWQTGGQNLASLEDERRISSGHHRAPQIPESDRLKLIGHARFNCSGVVSRAWRELLQAGELSANITSYYICNSSRKSYVPHAVRAAIANDVKILD